MSLDKMTTKRRVVLERVNTGKSLTPREQKILDEMEDEDKQANDDLLASQAIEEEENQR
jgi:hypothetical protein